MTTSLELTLLSSYVLCLLPFLSSCILDGSTRDEERKCGCYKCYASLSFRAYRPPILSTATLKISSLSKRRTLALRYVLFLSFCTPTSKRIRIRAMSFAITLLSFSVEFNTYKNILQVSKGALHSHFGARIEAYSAELHCTRPCVLPMFYPKPGPGERYTLNQQSRINDPTSSMRFGKTDNILLMDFIFCCLPEEGTAQYL